MARITRWVAPDADTPITGFIVDAQCIPLPCTIQDLLDMGLPATLTLIDETLATKSAVRHSLDAVRLIAPIEPRTLRDFVTFEQHVEGVARAVNGPDAVVVPEWYEAPTFYFTNPHTVLGDGDPVAPPRGCTLLDLECELAVILGDPTSVLGRESDGRNLSLDEAEAMIFGYTIFNDWSARDVQSREMKVTLGPAKGKDFAQTLGPWIVTADELASHVDAEGFIHLRAEAWINDHLLGADTFANMGWPFREMIAYASQDSRVRAGDVLGSGTTGGGCLAEQWGRRGETTPPPLGPGDHVRLTIEGIGELKTPVIARDEQSPPVRRARNRPHATHIKS